MSGILSIAWLVLQLTLNGVGLPTLGGSAPAAAFVRSATCYGNANASSGTGGCATLTTTAGDFAVVKLTLYGTTTEGSAPSDGANTYLTDASAKFTNSGPAVPLTRYYWVPSLAGGTVALKANSGAVVWSIGYMEFSGMNSSSPLDRCTPSNLLLAGTSSSATTMFGSRPTTAASQAVVAIGSTDNRTSASNSYVAADAWNSANRLAIPQVGDGDGSTMSYILNAYGIFSWEATYSAASFSQWSSGCLFKTASAGSITSGNLVIQHVDAECTGCTNTTAVTATLMNNNNATHGGIANWTVPSGFTFATAGQCTSLVNITANGTIRTGGSMGIQYDRTTNPTVSMSVSIPEAPTNYEVGACIIAPSTVTAGKFDNVLFLQGSTDSIGPQFLGNNTVTFECGGTDHGALTTVASNKYFFVVQGNGTGSGTHYMWAYDVTAGGGLVSGSPLTCTVGGANTWTNYSIGNGHAGGNTTGVTYFDNLQAIYPASLGTPTLQP